MCGDVSWAVMFSLRAFISAPAVEQFEQCRKADLLQLAEHYDIGGDRNVRKAELESLACLWRGAYFLRGLVLCQKVRALWRRSV